MQSRLETIPETDLTAKQAEILERIRSGPRGNLTGPFPAWIYSPGLAGPAQELGVFCRYRTSLPGRLSELAILVTARWWRAQTEWIVHEPIAREAGLSSAVIAALKAGQEPEFSDEQESLVYAIGQSLYRDRRVSEELYAKALRAFGRRGLVELVGIFGYYAFVAMTLNVFQMHPEYETSLPFEE